MKWKQKGCSKKGGLTMDWRKRELDKLLREEFEQRGFHLVGSGPIEWAPMLSIFKTHKASVMYIEREAQDYEYLAYKNMSAAIGANDPDIVRACLFIKIGQYKRAEMSPITEIVAFYRGRLYKFVNECSGFFFRMGYVRSAEEMKDAMKEIWSYAEHAVETWQRSIRTLIIENRWPEELYNSNFKFMEEE